MLLVMGARSYSAVLLKQNSICGIAQGCTSEKRAIDGVLFESMKFQEYAKGVYSDKLGISHDIDTSNLGEVLVCDGAIPFCESTKKLIDSGVKAVLQTGGTSTDDAFIDYCNEHGVVMVLLTSYPFFLLCSIATSRSLVSYARLGSRSFVRCI